ncbi:hypothetical protein GF366_04580 [Candidatus Peregrinibacteria bacterium]|nr:hypothetical protein [Candidatus Peregrinibacteria bacterium]
MKKITFITISIVLVNLLLLTMQANAVAEPTCETTNDCGFGEICKKGKCVESIEELLPRPGEYGEELRKQYPETGTVGDLPEVGTEEVFAESIKTILEWAMLFTIAAIVVAAIYYLKSQGKEEDIAKAKSIILYLVVGMAIMAAAYGIIAGIAQFEFFQAAP